MVANISATIKNVISSKARTCHLIKSFLISKELKKGAVNGDAHAYCKNISCVYHVNNMITITISYKIYILYIKWIRKVFRPP